jgi:hypothetical protein
MNFNLYRLTTSLGKKSLSETHHASPLAELDRPVVINFIVPYNLIEFSDLSPTREASAPIRASNLIELSEICLSA